MALDLSDAIVVVHVSRPPGGGAEENKPTKYQLGPDVRDDEDLYDSQERLIDDSYVDAAVEDAIAQVRAAVAARRCPPPRSPRCCACNSRGSWTTPSVAQPSAPAPPDRSGYAVPSTTQRTGPAGRSEPTAVLVADRLPDKITVLGRPHRWAAASG